MISPAGRPGARIAGGRLGLLSAQGKSPR